MDSEHITCVIATDSEILKNGISRMMKEEFKGINVIEVGNYEEVVGVMYDHDIELLVIGKITLGFEIEKRTAELMKINPCLRILCVCFTSCRKNLGLRMYRAGIKGVFIDSADDMKFKECVRRLMDGKTVFPEEVQEGIRNREHIHNADLNGRITGREMEVLKQMMEGSTLKQASDQMHIAIGTLSAMRSRLIKKLGADSIADAIIIALQYGVVKRLI